MRRRLLRVALVIALCGFLAVGLAGVGAADEHTDGEGSENETDSQDNDDSASNSDDDSSDEDNSGVVDNGPEATGPIDTVLDNITADLVGWGYRIGFIGTIVGLLLYVYGAGGRSQLGLKMTIGGLIIMALLTVPGAIIDLISGWAPS